MWAPRAGRRLAGDVVCNRRKDVLSEDFPLLRNSQRAMASADAGQLLVGRNEAANQVFRRETKRLLDAGCQATR